MAMSICRKMPVCMTEGCDPRNNEKIYYLKDIV